MRESVARIAKPAMIALAGAAAMFSATGVASAAPEIVEKDMPVAGDVAEAALGVPAAVASVPLAVASVPQRVIEVPMAVANVPLTAAGAVTGGIAGS